jgi:hypothetical protein
VQRRSTDHPLPLTALKSDIDLEPSHVVWPATSWYRPGTSAFVGLVSRLGRSTTSEGTLEIS